MLYMQSSTMQVKHGLATVLSRYCCTFVDNVLTKFAEEVSIGQTPNAAKFRRAPTTSVPDRAIRCGKMCSPEK